ncbi:MULTISPECIES: DNA-binding response regulator [Actinomadura]|nr:response regulator transcription factor [Actinomadura geliboluensis]
MLLDGLSAIFNAAGGFDVVVAPITERPLCTAALHHRPAVVVLGLVGVLDVRVVAALRRLKAAALDCKVVVVATGATGGAVRRAMDAGIEGLLPMSANAADLVIAVRTVATGVPYLDPVLERLAGGPATGPLTAREHEVLALMARGVHAKEIATELVLSVGTVRNHISAIMRKLDAKTQLDAVLIAEHEGWIELVGRKTSPRCDPAGSVTLPSPPRRRAAPGQARSSSEAGRPTDA